jgi:hypothetical protein
MGASTVSSLPPQDYPRRFGWPMRIFLGVFLFCLTFRCAAVVLPLAEWHPYYGIRELPPPLPPLLASAKANPGKDAEAPVTWADLADFFNPWPEAATLKRVQSPWDACKRGMTWLNGKIRLAECVCAVNEQWGMYAPDVATSKMHCRARLIYSDDSERIIKQQAEPADFTQYGHWIQERVINYECEVVKDAKQRKGFCNMLANRFPTNAAGARLQKIVLIYVQVTLVTPGDDPMEHYQYQNELTQTPPRRPGTHASLYSTNEVWDSYVYDVATGRGE